MDLYIIFTIVLTATIQSLFGVGILLFGTPILLLLEYNFLDILMILLPVSATINLLQIWKDYKKVDRAIYKRIVLLTVPFIIIFLLLVSKNEIDINLIIGLFLIFIALKDYLPWFKILFNKLLDFDKTFYIFMGAIHGATSLGGALLTAKMFHTDLDKYEKRATTAISYLTFVVFQIAVILYLDVKYELEYLIYIVTGLGVYLIVNRFLFNNISDSKYNLLFAIFLIISGFLLILH